MNFTAQVVIERPRDRVIELIRNPANIEAWQPGCQYGPLLAGEPDQVGSRRSVLIQMQGIRLEMIEVLVAFNPPDLISSVYTARGVTNRVENRFFENSPLSTRWVISNAFEFAGLMKLVGGIVGDFVPRQTVASMLRFKEFAERS